MKPRGYIAPYASCVCVISALLNNISLTTASMKIKRRVTERERKKPESLLGVLGALGSYKKLVRIKVSTHLCSSSLIIKKEDS